MWRAGIRRVALNGPALVRTRPLADGRYVVSGDLGDWLVLTAAELRALVQGPLPEGSPLRKRLHDHRMIHGEMGLAGATRALRARLGHLARGPATHTLVLARAGAPPMALPVADAALAVAFDSTSPDLHVVLSGDDPLDAWPTLAHVVERVAQRARMEDRAVRVTLRSDLTRLNEDHHAWLVGRGVGVRAVFDDEALADPRSTPCWWVTRFRREERPVDLEVACTSPTLEQPERVVRAAIRLGCDHVALRRPVDVGGPRWSAFCRAVVEGLVARAARKPGPAPREVRTLRGLTRLVGPDASIAALDAPPATDELAYDTDGAVYATEAGLALAADGDPLFLLGHTATAPYQELVRHPTRVSLILASAPYGQPGCTTCAWLPFCEADPVRAYVEQGSLQGRMGDADHCQEQLALFDDLVARLEAASEPTTAALRAWVPDGDG